MLKLGRLSHLNRILTVVVMWSCNTILVLLLNRSIELYTLRLALPIINKSFIWVIIIGNVIVLAWLVDVVIKLVIQHLLLLLCVHAERWLIVMIWLSITLLVVLVWEAGTPKALEVMRHMGLCRVVRLSMDLPRHTMIHTLAATCAFHLLQLCHSVALILTTNSLRPVHWRLRWLLHACDTCLRVLVLRKGLSSGLRWLSQRCLVLRINVIRILVHFCKLLYCFLNYYFHNLKIFKGL